MPEIGCLPEKLIIIQTPQLDPMNHFMPGDEKTHTLRLVNGQINPTITIRPGEVQRWRILNASANQFYKIALDDHPLHFIAMDGNTLAWPREIGEQDVIGPGERREVLVRGGEPGVYAFRTVYFDQGFDRTPDTVLATVVVQGEPMESPAIPETLLPFVDLREFEIDRRRIITMSVNEDPLQFLLDGKVFDMNRVDQTVKLGAIEEWEIRNTSTEMHPFHIHVNPFQVVAVNGEPVEVLGYEDTVPVPIGGSITFRTRFWISRASTFIIATSSRTRTAA